MKYCTMATQTYYIFQQRPCRLYVLVFFKLTFIEVNSHCTAHAEFISQDHFRSCKTVLVFCSCSAFFVTLNHARRIFCVNVGSLVGDQFSSKYQVLLAWIGRRTYHNYVKPLHMYTFTPFNFKYVLSESPVCRAQHILHKKMTFLYQYHLQYNNC
jgi:hypothetical protein